MLLFFVNAILFAQDSVSPSDIQGEIVQPIVGVEDSPARQNDSFSGRQRITPSSVTTIFDNRVDTLDSSSVSQNLTNPTFFDSLAQANQGIEENKQLLQEHNKSRDFVLPVILFLLLLYLALLRYQYAKQLRENLTVLFNTNLGQQIFRDREFSPNIFSLLLYINAILVIGVYIYQLTVYFKITLPFEKTILNIAICVTVFPVMYILKSIVYFFLKIVFNFDFALQFFRFNSLILYQLLAVSLLPCVILMASVQDSVLHWVVIVSLSLVGFTFLVRFIKGIFICVSFVKFHILYFLLYFCAVEIAPLLIAFKVFSEYAV